MMDEQKEFYLTLFEPIVDAKFQIDQRNYGQAHDTLTYVQYTLRRFYIDGGGNLQELEAILEI